MEILQTQAVPRKGFLEYDIRNMSMNIIGYIRLVSSLQLIPFDFDMHDDNAGLRPCQCDMR